MARNKKLYPPYGVRWGHVFSSFRRIARPVNVLITRLFLSFEVNLLIALLFPHFEFLFASVRIIYLAPLRFDNIAVACLIQKF